MRASEVVAQISERGAHDIIQKRARIFFSADSTSGMESLHGVDRLCVCLFVHGVSELFGKRWSIDEYAVEPAEVVQAVDCWRSVHGLSQSGGLSRNAAWSLACGSGRALSRSMRWRKVHAQPLHDTYPR